MTGASKNYPEMETVESSVLSGLSPRQTKGALGLGRKSWQSPRWYRGWLRRAGESRGRGEIVLMWAILEDALKCYQHRCLPHNHQALVLADEAEAWLLSDDTSYLFSYLNICTVLDLDPQHLRHRLLRWSRCAKREWSKPRGSRELPVYDVR